MPSAPSAEPFKEGELQLLATKDAYATFAFGNHESDVAAYDAASVPFRFYYDNSSTILRRCSQVRDLRLLPKGAPQKGDWRIEACGDLAPALAAGFAPCTQ